MGNESKSSRINYFDDEFDEVIADAMEQFGQTNIRFRSPNRNGSSVYKQKLIKPERETN